MDTNDKATRYDQRLAEILSAAAQVFAEQGYDRASIRMVAERAGVSVPGLYHYVRSKEEILFLIQLHIFTDLVERFNEGSRQTDDPVSRLELLIRNHLERFLSNMAELIVCSREIDRLKGDFHSQVDAKRREYFGQALGVFRELSDWHGGTRVHPRTAALAMFGTINWVYTWYRHESGISADVMAGEFVRLYLRGVLPEGDSSGQGESTAGSEQVEEPKKVDQ
jgi:AcrR family transcriptional regulator